MFPLSALPRWHENSIYAFNFVRTNYIACHREPVLTLVWRSPKVSGMSGGLHHRHSLRSHVAALRGTAAPRNDMILLTAR